MTAENRASLDVAGAIADAYGLWKAGAHQPAELLCREILSAAPGTPAALYLLGVAALDRGQADAGAELLVQACASPLATAAFHIDLAERARLAGRLAEAEAAARRAVALDPCLAPAWNNLAVVLLDRGSLDESDRCVGRAVALDPGFAEALNNRGNAERRRGRLTDAVASYRDAIACQPGLASAHGNLAVTLCDLGDLAGALAHASQAAALEPWHGRAYGIAAAIAGRLGEPDRAEDWIRKGLEAVPDDPGLLLAQAQLFRGAGKRVEARSLGKRLSAAGEDAWSLLAELDQDDGHYDRAIAAWDRAIERARWPVPALSAKANLLLELGRIDEAERAFGHALGIAPEHGPALFGQASIASLRRQAPDIARLEGLLADGHAQALDDRVTLHFALGRAYLDGADPDRAFAHFASGNALRRGAYAYDVAEDERLMASIAEAFPAALIARAAGGGDPDETPVFIVGMPRSGTSLLEQILSAHPDIQGAGELLHLKHLVMQDLAGHGPFPGIAAELTAGQLRSLGRRYVEATSALAPGAKRIIDKLPLNFYFAGLVHLMLPHARIIHIRRDPLDTCLSCHTTLFREPVRFAHDLTELGRFYRGYERLMDHWRRVLPAERFIELDYDRLVADPEPQARRLIGFCGVDWDAACLRSHESSHPIRTASRLQARQPIHRNSVGRAQRYREYLGPLIAEL
jgi:tetratricopeptide (TPR) repeat protein